MLKKFKNILFLIALIVLVLPFAACASPYDSIKINLSTSIAAFNNENSVTLNRQLNHENVDANKFTITANVSAKKGVPTDLQVTSSKPDVVKILDVKQSGNSTIVSCEGIAAGEAQIKFVSYGGKSATARVFVNEPVRNISMAYGYEPFAYVGRSVQFDVSKVLFNNIPGAVEPNSENKHIQFTPSTSAIDVSPSGLITIPDVDINQLNLSYDNTGTPYFDLRISSTSDAGASDSGQIYTYCSVKIVAPRTISLTDFTFTKTNENEPLQNEVFALTENENLKAIDVDLQLFPTDPDYKSAKINVDYRISNSSNIPNTIIEFVEVENFSNHNKFNSGHIKLTQNETNLNEATISIGNIEGDSAYINVYAALEGYENSTKILIARINVLINNVPNKIELTVGEKNELVGDQIDIYNKLSIMEYQKITPIVFGGREELSDAIIYVDLNAELLNVVDVKGATREGTSSRYRLNKNEETGTNESLGLVIKDGIDANELKDITKAGYNNISFTAAYDVKFKGQKDESVIEFVRTKRKVALNLKLSVDRIVFDVKTEDVENLKVEKDNTYNDITKLSFNAVINTNVENGEATNGYLPKITIGFKAFLGGNEVTDLSNISFIHPGLDDALFKALFDIDEDKQTITVTPKSSFVSKVIVAASDGGVGINSETNLIEVNFYQKPKKISLTLGGKDIENSPYNMQTNYTEVGVFEPFDSENNKLNYAQIELTNLKEESGVWGSWTKEKDESNGFSITGNTVIFNSNNKSSGTYNFVATFVDAGGNELTKEFSINVYKPIYATGFYIEKFERGVDNPKPEIITNGTTDTLYTTNSIAFAEQTKYSTRKYKLYINGLEDLRQENLNANGIKVEARAIFKPTGGAEREFLFLHNNEFTEIIIEAGADTGNLVLTFTVYQNDMQTPVGTVIVNIAFVDAPKVDNLYRFGGLQFIGPNTGYLLSRNEDNAETFAFNFDKNLFEKALNKNLGAFITNSNIATWNGENKTVSLTGTAGEADLYIYSFDSLNNKNLVTSEIDITSNLNYIKIKIIVANGSTVPFVVTTEEQLVNITGEKNYQLMSNIKITNQNAKIANFNGKLFGNNFVVYNAPTGLLNGVNSENVNISYGAVDNSTDETTNTTAKQVVDFAPYEPVNLADIMDAGATDFSFKYILNDGATKNGVVANGYAVVEHARFAQIVANVAGTNITKIVEFKYRGTLPATRSDSDFNFSIRKNYSVNLKKLQVSKPYSVSYKVYGENSSNAIVDNSGYFRATEAGTYTVIESVSQQDIGIILTNTITITVFEGATNISASIVNGNQIIAGTNAQVAPFETLAIRLRVITDMKDISTPTLAIENNFDLSNFTYSSVYLGSDVAVSDFSKVSYQDFMFYIRVKDNLEIQKALLDKQVNFVFSVPEKFVANDDDVFTIVRVDYINSLPNYIDFYNIDEKVTTIANSNNAFGQEDSTNELIPEFTSTNGSVGGYQTFILDLFPDYTAAESLTISVAGVKKINATAGEDYPLPQYYNANIGTRENLIGKTFGLQSFLFNTLKKQYFVLPIYMPLESDTGVQAQLGDKYQFSFKVALNGTTQEFEFTQVLDVSYPLLLSGDFIDSNKQVSLTQKVNNKMVTDTVAVGTTFGLKLNVETLTSLNGRVNFESFNENISKLNIDFVDDNNGGYFKCTLLNNNIDYNTPITLSFRATKTLEDSGRILKSKLFTFLIQPVKYKIRGVEFFDDNVLISGGKNLSITAEHKLRVKVIAEYNENFADQIQALNNQLNGTTKNSNSVLPYIHYYLPRTIQTENPTTQSLSFNPNDANKYNKWIMDDKTYLHKINYDGADRDSTTITFAHKGPLTFEANVMFEIVNGEYNVISNSDVSNYVEAFNTKREFNFYLSSNADSPTPINSFDEDEDRKPGLAQFITTSANSEQDFSDVNLILTNDIEIGIDTLKNYLGEGSIFAANFASLDGNGYSIKLNSGALDFLATNALKATDSENENTIINVGLFTSVGKNTIIKNLNIELVQNNSASWNLLAGTDATIDAPLHLNFGFLTAQNNGIITNCKVLNKQGNRLEAAIYPFPYNSTGETRSNVSATIGGLVSVNSGFITNSTVEVDIRVGGLYINEQQNYTSNGSFVVGGFVGENNGKIASSKFVNSNLNNYAFNHATDALTAGFVAINNGRIMYSYAEGFDNAQNTKNQTGSGSEESTNENESDKNETAGGISKAYRGTNKVYSNATVAGFVFNNYGYIGDSYSNLTLESGKGVAGFVQNNGLKQNNGEVDANAVIENSLSLSDIINYSTLGYRPFTGTSVNENQTAQTSNNFGTIYNCYTLAFSVTDTAAVSEVPSLDINQITDAAQFSGFAFSVLSNSSSTGVWKMDVINGKERPTLVSANRETNVRRTYEFTQAAGTDAELHFYSEALGCEAGTVNNPWLVYNVETFNKITDKYNSTSNYRIICDIEFDSSDNRILTSTKTFYGKLDGNGMKLSNIYINLGKDTRSSIGLFANLSGKKIISDEEVEEAIKIENDNDNESNVGTYIVPAEVKALEIDVSELLASQVANVGVVAGVVSDANVYNINITSSKNAIIHGKNAVGGIVGLVVGYSQIFNCTSSVDVLSTYAGENTTINEIGAYGATSALFDSNSEIKTFYDAATYNNETETSAVNIDLTEENEKNAEAAFSEYVAKNSYAGGIVGIYNGIRSNHFTPVLSLLHANNARIEGGVAGGVLGLVAHNNLASDLRYTTDATHGRVNGRITAGGVVGENRGIISFARSEHIDSVQKQIDKVSESGKAENLYNSSLYNNNVFGMQKVYATGGIVGINIGGTVNESYSRLEVNNQNATYAGGVVGVINGGKIDTVYTTSYVYARERAGGIIGFMCGEKNDASKVELTSILALNIIDNTRAENLEGLDIYASIIGRINSSLGEEISNYLQINNGITTANDNDIDTKQTNYAISKLFINKNNTDPVIPFYRCENDDAIENINKVFNNIFTLNNFPDVQNAFNNDNDAHKEVFKAFYYDVNESWQDLSTSQLNKNIFPKLINFRNTSGKKVAIKNATDLIEFAKSYNSNTSFASYLKCTIVITNNIDLNDLSKQDLNKLTNNFLCGGGGAFMGTVEGNINGHTKINLAGHSLFENVDNGATFRNLTIENDITEANNFGSFAINAQNSNFANCNVTTKISGTISGNVGGFVGTANNVEFNDCVATVSTSGSVTLGTANIGGFAGGATQGTINIFGGTTNFNVTATATANSGINIGGFVGSAKEIFIDTYKTTSTNSDNTTITVVKSPKVHSQITLSGSCDTANIGGAVGAASDGDITGVKVENWQTENADTTPTINQNKISTSTSTTKLSATTLNTGLIGGSTAGVNYNNCQVISGTLNIGATGSTVNNIGYVGSLTAKANNITNSYSYATVKATSGVNVGGLAGSLGSGSSASFFNGTIDAGNANAAGFAYLNSGTINKCFVGTGIVKGANASGFVFTNSGLITTSYSTATVEAETNASGLIDTNNGTIENSYFAGRNMTGTNRYPIYNGYNGNNVLYCKNFGFEGLSANGAKSIDEMLKADGLTSGFTTSYTIDGENGEKIPKSCFPIISDVAYKEFNNAQQGNENLNPEDINSIEKIKNLNGFYRLSSTTDVKTLDSSKTFTGILIGGGDITASAPLFNKIDGATIFGVNIVGTINGNGSIANIATNSFIEKCSFNGTLTNTTANEIVGGLVGTATNTQFRYSYVGEAAILSASSAVGGLVGNATNSSFNSCFFAGTITGGLSMAGIYNTGNATISNCYVSGNLLNANNQEVNAFYIGCERTPSNCFSIAYIQSAPQEIMANINLASGDAWITNENGQIFPRLKNVGGQNLGTRINPIKISTIQDLQNLNTPFIENGEYKRDEKGNIVYTYETNKKSYMLTSDIDFTNFAQYQNAITKPDSPQFTHFEPIENFAGTLYGNGHSINNLLITNKKTGAIIDSTKLDENGDKINDDKANHRQSTPLGLFANTTDRAYINGITLNNAEMYASNVVDGAGFIIGSVNSGAQAYLYNCHVTNSKMFAGREKKAGETVENRVLLTGKVNTFVGTGSTVENNCDTKDSNGNATAINISYSDNDGSTKTISKNVITNNRIAHDDGFYHIYTAEEFYNWAKTANRPNAKLESNIDLSAYSWAGETVLGVFSGVLDGNYYTISNIYAQSFITENNGTVKNLNMFNTRITGVEGAPAIGVIANVNKKTIINCFTSGIVINRNNTASIAGLNEDEGKIINCFGAVCSGISDIVSEYNK